ncbi:MAG: hypothetical protein ACRCST_07815 [Turicibacter sp.]
MIAHILKISMMISSLVFLKVPVTEGTQIPNMDLLRPISSYEGYERFNEKRTKSMGHAKKTIQEIDKVSNQLIMAETTPFIDSSNQITQLYNQYEEKVSEYMIDAVDESLNLIMETEKIEGNEVSIPNEQPIVLEENKMTSESAITEEWVDVIANEGIEIADPNPIQPVDVVDPSGNSAYQSTTPEESGIVNLDDSNEFDSLNVDSPVIQEEVNEEIEEIEVYQDFRQTFYSVDQGEVKVGFGVTYEDESVKNIDNVMHYYDEEYEWLPIVAVNIDEVLDVGLNEKGIPLYYGTILEITYPEGEVAKAIVLDACGACSRDNRIDLWVYSYNYDHDVTGIEFKIIRDGFKNENNTGSGDTSSETNTTN